MEQRANQVIATHLGVGLDRVVPDASFQDDLGADSLDLIELAMAFEEEFGILISDEQAERITRVAHVYELLG